MCQVAKKDIGNYLSALYPEAKTLNLVSQKEVNHLKRINYGDYYKSPDTFNGKMKQMEHELKQVDVQFTRL